MARYETIKGLFGQLIHYKDGVKVGESWDGLIPGSKNHYNVNSGYAGYSDPGLFADQVHHNEFGGRIGESYKDDFDITRHYSDRSGYAGSSHPGLIGTDTYMDDDSDLSFDSFDSDW